MAYDFDGSLDYLEVADNATLSITGALTISCWFQNDLTSTGGNNLGIVAKYRNQVGNTNQRAYVIAQNNQTVSFTTSPDGTSTGLTAATSGNVLTAAGSWHHIAAVYNPSTQFQVFLDGSSVATAASPPAAIADTAAPLWVGNHFTTTDSLQSFNGKLAEVAIWNTNLLDAEVTSLSKAFSAVMVRPAFLVFYAPLIRPIIDIVNGFSISSNGTVTQFDHPRIIRPSRPQPWIAAAAAASSIAAIMHSYRQRRI